ncbi:hypothetical protein H0H81_004721 [Sphagnurus paluster]|uniref:Uncharacterized protein n=1 Tax=Sphagnurus paluster TaxID=117069 RepID=A0A9P7GP96_9AGAR|nr:hypothetical protein H0H81_004721 [Sphagnurus paluster]
MAGKTIISVAYGLQVQEKDDPYIIACERGLDPEANNSASMAFGICPNRHMAFSSWIAIASMITTFDIRKAVDEDGKIIEPSHEYLSGLACKPLPFKCSIKPRSPQAEYLIRATVDAKYF